MNFSVLISLTPHTWVPLLGHQVSGTSVGFITLFSVQGGPTKFGGNKQARAKWAKSQVRGGASNLTEFLVDAEGCEEQSHRLWARNSTVVGGRCKWRTQVSTFVKNCPKKPLFWTVWVPRLSMEGALCIGPTWVMNKHLSPLYSGFCTQLVGSTTSLWAPNTAK